MGTSQSSKGSPGGVPMVPPWVPDAPPQPPADTPAPADQETAPEGGDDPAKSPDSPAPPPLRPPIPIAPAGRFTAARRNLGSFANNGDGGAMRRGVGQYVKNGYGGANTAARRMAGTGSSAVAMYNVLSTAGGAAGVPGPGPRIDRALLAGKSANEVINAVIEAVRPTDGSQDTEAARASLHDALSELLVRYPDADLLDLTDEQRDFSVEQFVAMDVFRRFDLDLGAHIRDKAPSATTALGRMKEVRDYIRQTIAEAFRKLRTDGQKLSTANASRVVTDALRSAMRVFESYAQ